MRTMPAEIVDELTGLTRRQRLTLAAWIDEPDAVIGPRFGISKNGATKRRMRGLAKLTPEQRAAYLGRVNRRRNRTLKTAIGTNAFHRPQSYDIELARGLPDGDRRGRSLRDE